MKLSETKPIGIELNRARPDEVLDRGMHEPVTQDVLAFGAAAPGGGFFDFAPVHLVTTASLATRLALRQMQRFLWSDTGRIW